MYCIISLKCIVLKLIEKQSGTVVTYFEIHTNVIDIEKLNYLKLSDRFG